MLYEIISRDVTTKDYPISYAFTGSSRIEEKFVLMKQELPENPFFYRSLLPSFEIDLSSVLRPQFEPMNKTSLIEKFYEEILPEETIEYDIIVRMPPRKKYTIEIEVKSIKKAKPRIVEPE